MIKTRTLNVLDKKLALEMRVAAGKTRQAATELKVFGRQYRVEAAQMNQLRSAMLKHAKMEHLLPHERIGSLSLMQKNLRLQESVVAARFSQLSECQNHMNQVLSQQHRIQSKQEKISEIKQERAAIEQERIETEHSEEAAVLNYCRNLSVEVPTVLPSLQEFRAQSSREEERAPQDHQPPSAQEDDRKAQVMVPFEDQEGRPASLEIVLNYQDQVLVEVNTANTPTEWSNTRRERQISQALSDQGIAVKHVAINGRRGL